MPLVINEEQLMLKESAREFLKERSPVEALRKLRDSQDAKGYDENLWKEMAEMGWAGLTIPEEYSGLNFGYVGFGQILEETGRNLTASPLVSTILLGATTINLGGNPSQKEKYLPAIAEGKTLVALALEEKKQHQPYQVALSAASKGEGFVLNGKKQFVLDGHVADHIIVVARTSGRAGDREGLSLFLVDKDTAGLTVKRTIMMDSRNAAVLEFDGVEIPAEALIGDLNGGAAILDRVLDIARIGLSAEMLGTMQEAFDRTLAYIKERQQFGVSIAIFQSLQHRAANMYCEIELCKSVVLQALQAIDAGVEDLSELASLAKAKTGETIKLVSNEGVQMFGGIGMTDEAEIGFFLKRARVAQYTFGDYNYHLNRYASLKGF